MTHSIAKTLKIAIVTLVISPFLSLSFNHLPANAELPKSTIQIAIDPLLIDADRESAPDDSETETETETTNSDREKAKEYLVKGWEAEKSGNTEEAREHYQKTIETDDTWGGGYLMLAHLAGKSEIGVKYAQAALERFEAEQNREGIEAASEMLAEYQARS